MRVSTRGRYGMRFMLDLAAHADERAVSLGDVAQRQGISEKYLWQIVNPLKNAGIVQAVRGAHGGYRLARDPHTLTVREILTAIEGSLALTECAEDGAACDLGATCVVRQMWKDLTDALARAMDEVTLGHLLGRYRAAQGAESLTYEI